MIIAVAALVFVGIITTILICCKYKKGLGSIDKIHDGIELPRDEDKKDDDDIEEQTLVKKIELL